jgi:hypothetical protein
VFVLVEYAGPSYLPAVNKETGKDRWKAERKSRVAWISPVVVAQGGRARVVLPALFDLGWQAVRFS